MKLCSLCKINFVGTRRFHTDGTELTLCDVCYEIKYLCDGMVLDWNIDEVEEIINLYPLRNINFVRTSAWCIN